MQRHFHQKFRNLTCIVVFALLLPESANAGKKVAMPIDELLAASGAVLRVRVNSVDSEAGMSLGFPATEFNLTIEETLHGSIEHIDGNVGIVQRGGKLSDGSELTFSTAADLEPGNTYILFLRRDYYVSPFHAATHSIVERVDAGGRDVGLTQAGRLLRVNSNFGLQNLGPPTDSASVMAASSWEDLSAYIRSRVAGRPQDESTLASRVPLAYPGDSRAGLSLTPYEVGPVLSGSSSVVAAEQVRVVDVDVDGHSVRQAEESNEE